MYLSYFASYVSIISSVSCATYIYIIFFTQAMYDSELIKKKNSTRPNYTTSILVLLLLGTNRGKCCLTLSPDKISNQLTSLSLSLSLSSSNRHTILPSRIRTANKWSLMSSHACLRFSIPLVKVGTDTPSLVMFHVDHCY